MSATSHSYKIQYAGCHQTIAEEMFEYATSSMTLKVNLVINIHLRKL